jgi:hypothetical protein
MILCKGLEEEERKGVMGVTSTIYVTEKSYAGFMAKEVRI